MIRHLKKILGDELKDKDLELLYKIAIQSFLEINNSKHNSKFNLYIINKIFKQLDRKKFDIENQASLSTYDSHLSKEIKLRYQDARSKADIVTKRLLYDLELEIDKNTSFSIGYQLQENEKNDLAGIRLNIKKYNKTDISCQELVEFKFPLTNYFSTTFMLDIGGSSEKTLGKIFNDIETKNNFVWIANSFEKKHLEAFAKLRKINPLSNLKYFKTEFYSLKNDFFLTLSEVESKSNTAPINQGNNQIFKEELSDAEKKERTKEIKKILRGVYLKALSNISNNIGLIYFNELKYLCVDEIEWIVRNENPEFEETQIAEIMAHVKKVVDSSIGTTIRKCTIGVGENIWDRINDKKLLKIYRLFRVVNGEKIPKKMLLASYNFDKNKKSGQSYHTHYRFRTINDFEALGLVNKKIYYKTSNDEMRILLKEIKTINQYSATVVGKGKVRFEKNIMSLAEATRIINSRQWEIINKHFPDEGKSHPKPFEIIFETIGEKISTPSFSWHTEEDCAQKTSLEILYRKLMKFHRDSYSDYEFHWRKSLK